MNPLKKFITSVPCPTCEAEVGVNCKIAKGTAATKFFGIAHSARWTAADQHTTKRMKNLPRVEKTPVRGYRSSYCLCNRHQRCKGSANLKHGLRVECNCPCHARLQSIALDPAL